MHNETSKNFKSTKILLQESIINSFLSISKLHFQKPFGNGLVQLDFLQSQILNYIASEPTSIKEIGQKYQITRRTVESNILYLIKLELIDKKTKKSGGRGSLISITDYGKEILQTIDKQMQQFFDFTKDKYSIKQERLLIEFLDDLTTSSAKLSL